MFVSKDGFRRMNLKKK